ncbi:hypothetical protein CR513_57383, partial [Mucuna pruriens]
MGNKKLLVDKNKQSFRIHKHVIILASFTSEMRYMFNNCQDVKTICKRFGYSDLFITITCDTNWCEIHEFVTPLDKWILYRVFKLKPDEIITYFKKKYFLFGRVNASIDPCYQRFKVMVHLAKKWS